MNRIIFLLLLITFQKAAIAQFSVKGRVVNTLHEAAAFTPISLYQANHTPLVQTTTDSAGIYLIHAAAGTYYLVLDESGQELSRKTVLLNGDTTLPDIIIDEATALNGVSVTARKLLVTQKTDRLIFHVENAISATGGNALDVLKATPTVRVQNETIAIAGKGEVMVMIDDRLQRIPQEDLAALLKSIPANTIKSIEVISTPPAKYDAEGLSGLINIKLKSARENAWSANLGASLIRKTYNSGNLQGLFSYNRNKISLQASVSAGREKSGTTADSRIFYPEATWHQSVRDTALSNRLSLGIGVDYQLRKSWTTGIKYSGSFTQRKSGNSPFTSIYSPEQARTVNYISTAVNAQNKPEMNSISWYHTLRLGAAGKELTLDLDHFNYQKSDRQSFAGNEWDQHKNIIPQAFFASANANLNRIHNYAARADLSLPLTFAQLSFGAKFSATNTLNDLKVYDHRTGEPVLDTDQSNVFTYKEYNEALYFSAQKKLSKQWESQVGLRMEATQTAGYAHTIGQKNKNAYVQFFPTAYFTYQPDEQHSFALNYSRRIRRPGFDYLNPFVLRTSPYFYSEGNPRLQPSFINNIALSYTRNQRWVNSLYYTRVSDFSQELAIIDPVSNVTRLTPLNYANTSQIGYSTYYNFNKWHWWNSFTGFNIAYQKVNAKIPFIQSTSGYNAYVYSNNDFTLNKAKSVLLGLNYAFQPAGRYQVFDISASHMLDISMKLLIGQQKFALTLVAEDILNAQRPLISYTSNGIINNVRHYNDTRVIRLSLSCNFGNNRIKSDHRNQGNEEEKSRTNQ